MGKRIKLSVIMIITMFLVCTSGNKSYAGESYSLDGTTITIKANEGSKINDIVNEAITAAGELHKENPDKIYTVKLPKGSYKLDDTIHVYGDIILDAKETTLEYVGDKKNDMIMSGDVVQNISKKIMAGYGTYKNITILGGTWKGKSANTASLVKLAHLSNVKLEGCTFVGGGGAHQVEVASKDGFTVNNCTFRDMKGNGGKGKQEALQFDIPANEHIFGGVVLDGTPMKNVKVTNCTFKNLLRGVGSHSMLVGTYHENVEISNNKFSNVKGECIVALCYKNCTITGNVIENSGAGILVQYFKKDVSGMFNTIYDGKVKATGAIQHNSKTVISNNTITTAASTVADELVGIKVYGSNLTKDMKSSSSDEGGDKIKKANFYISNVEISNNTVKSYGYGIHVYGTRDSVINKNKISFVSSKANQDGIFVEMGSQNVAVTNNKITKPKRNGIFVKDSSQVSKIENNNITSVGSFGIAVYTKSTVDSIKSNTIKNPKSIGISVNIKSKIKNIKKNTISNSKGKGIMIYDNSQVTGAIDANTINVCKASAVDINKKSKVKKISGNQIKSAGGKGIIIEVSSKVSSAIEGNNISKCTGVAIYLTGKSRVNSISSNTIADSKSKGIAVDMGSAVSKSIDGNTISKTDGVAIALLSSKNKLSVKNNVISLCNAHPIFIDIEKSTAFAVTIEKNKITTKKKLKYINVVNGKVNIKKNTMKGGVK